VIDCFAAALWTVPIAQGRPVTCSRGWLPVPARRRRYRYAGDIPASDQHFDAALAAHVQAGDIRARTIEPGSAAWRFPPGTPEQEKVGVRERLFGHVIRVGNAPLAASDGDVGRREATA
jgi:hypothetical protein